MTALLLALLAASAPDGPHYDDGFSCLPLSGGTVTSETLFSDGLEVTGDYDNTAAADSCILDNNGLICGQKLTDIAPQGTLIRSQAAFAGGTQTASNLILCGGQDETLCAIDGADPSVSCAGDNDTITVTVINSNGTSTATVLTEGTEWTASASVATTCASLASAVNALAGVGATCTSPNVLFTLDNNTCLVTLAESTAGCTTVSTGTAGAVHSASPLRGPLGTAAIPSLSFSTDTNTGFFDGGGDDLRFTVGGAQRAVLSTTAFSTSSGTTISGSGTIVSTRTTDIGWSIVAAANQACNTTCTNACVPLGYDSGAPGVYLACTDATADVCVCAGAN